MKIRSLIIAATQLLLFHFFICFCSFAAAAAPGDLDVTFAGGGVTPYRGMNMIGSSGIALQPDGKILSGDTQADGNSATIRRFAVLRYLPNGLLDPSFGQNGVAVSSTFWYDALVNDIAVLPDGKIVAAGNYRIPDVPYFAHDMLFSIFSPEGTEIANFTVRLNSGVSSIAEAVTVQPDGKFLVAGETGRVEGFIFKQVVMRFLPDGTPDVTFGNGNGFVINEPAVLGRGIAIQSDGKIIVTGRQSISRYLPNGELDVNFGGSGMITTPLPTDPYTAGFNLAVQPDGKIIGAASSNEAGNFDFGAFRLNPDGSLDSSFGVNGVVTTNVSAGSDNVKDVVLQPDGKILLFGYTHFTGGSQPNIVRYTANGALDNSFGSGGIVGLPNERFFLTDAALQSDGKILALGDGKIARYLNDASAAPRPTNFDFDGDSWADFAVTRFEDTNFNWYAVNNPLYRVVVNTQWGLAEDKFVPADYDGDRKTDVAVFRNGMWLIMRSSNQSISAVQFGQANDIPVPGDFDGDGKADWAVFRQGFWFILNSSNGSFRAVQFGVETDKPLIGDFDGDGKADLSVYRNGNWYVSGSTAGFSVLQFGLGSDKPVPADYDGDGKTDYAVFRPSDATWYFFRSQAGFGAIQFGLSSDQLAPADYDGDGKTDAAVFRHGTWFIQQTTGGFRAVNSGLTNDIPLASSFIF